MVINLNTYPLKQVRETTLIENFIKKYNVPTNYFRLIHPDNNAFFRSIGYRFIQDIASKRQITKLEQLYDQIKEHPIKHPPNINLEKGFHHLKSELIKSRSTQKIDQWISQCKEIDYFIVCIVRHLIRKFLKKNNSNSNQIQTIENWNSNANSSQFKAISQALQTKIHIYGQKSVQVYYNQLRPIEFLTYLISHDGKWYLLLQSNGFNKKKKKPQKEKQFASGFVQSKYQLRTPIKSNQNNTQTCKKQCKEVRDFIKTNEYLVKRKLQERITQQQKQSTDRESYKSIQGKIQRNYRNMVDLFNQQKKIKSSTMFPKAGSSEILPIIYNSVCNENKLIKSQEQLFKNKQENKNKKFQILDQNKNKNASRNQVTQINDSYYPKNNQQHKAKNQSKLKNTENKKYQRGNTKVLTMKDFQKKHQLNNKEQQKIDQPLFIKQQITFRDNLSSNKNFNQKIQNNNNNSNNSYQNQVKNDWSNPSHSNYYYNSSNISKKPEDKNIQIGSFSILKDIQTDNKLSSLMTKAPSYNSSYYSQSNKQQKIPVTDSFKIQNHKLQSKQKQISQENSASNNSSINKRCVKMNDSRDRNNQTNYNSLNKNYYQINSNYNPVNINNSIKEGFKIKANNDNKKEGISNGEINKKKQQKQKEGNKLQKVKSSASNANSYRDILLINKIQRINPIIQNNKKVQINNKIYGDNEKQKYKMHNNNFLSKSRKNSYQNLKQDINKQNFYKQQPKYQLRNQCSRFKNSYDIQHNNNQQITRSPRFGKSSQESHQSWQQNNRISTRNNFNVFNKNKMNYKDYMKSNINPKIYNKNIIKNNYYQFEGKKSRQSLDNNNQFILGKNVPNYKNHSQYYYNPSYQDQNIIYKQNRLEKKKNEGNYHLKNKIVQTNHYHTNSNIQTKKSFQKNYHYIHNNIKPHHYRHPSNYTAYQYSPSQYSNKSNSSTSSWKNYLHQQSRINQAKKDYIHMQNFLITPSRIRDYYNFESTAPNVYNGRQRIMRENNSWGRTHIESTQSYKKRGYIKRPYNFNSNPKEHIHYYMHNSSRQKYYNKY